MTDEIGTRVDASSGVARARVTPFASLRRLIVGSVPVSKDLGLRPLSPEYVPEQHQDYVNLIVGVLVGRERHAARNIAVTGHYGSGKSSVLGEVESRLDQRRSLGLFRRRIKAINLSLPSLGVGDGRLSGKGDQAKARTNLIQKEILKQLLYRQSPSKMPGSRYGRLDKFRPRVLVTLLFAFIGAGLGLVVSVPRRVAEALPNSANLNEALVFWLSLVGMALAFGGASLLFQRLFYKDIRISDFGAGTAKLGLSKDAGTYFDEYLDEIVYYFQRSNTSVVIFEDLDRFKDPHIFETLRELNVLLNNSGQIRRRPIKFVYAVRDSIFEQLDIEVGPAEEDSGDEKEHTESKSGVATAKSADPDSLRLTSTNRTKFFDLIVPMVPFISHRTSRELIDGQLEAVPEEERPTQEVLDIVGAYLTDMRLIKNICNEYEVFSRRILAKNGLMELRSDGLFAMVVYKNLWMADYEAIRTGDSRLDDIYRAYRAWVTEQTADGRKETAEATAQLRRLSAIVPRSDGHGQRLQEVIQAFFETKPQPGATATVEASGTTFPWADVTTPAFWQAWLAKDSNLVVDFRPGSNASHESFTRARIEKLMGEQLSLSDWTDWDRTELEAQAKAGREAQEFAIRASMKAALAETDKRFVYESVDQSLRVYAKAKLEGADLAFALLEAGFIDENFTLYVTQFPGGASASAMNFIIKAVQRDKADINYEFIGGPVDIASVLNREERRLLDGESVYNVQIFDYFLASESPMLDGPIARLAGAAKSADEFIATYLERGKQTATFVRRLSAAWPNIFSYLRQHPHETNAVNDNWLSSALLGASTDVTYSVSEEDRELIQTEYVRLPAITGRLPPTQAEKIADVLRGLGVKFAQLPAIGEPLRARIVERSLYGLTIANLRAGLGPDVSLSLDCLKAKRPEDVYPYVLAHLDTYLAGAVEEKIPSVADPAAFTGILDDLVDDHEAQVGAVASAAAPECLVENLGDLRVSAWPILADAHRFELTDTNVIRYIGEHGVDGALADWLAADGRIKIAAAHADEAARVKLAVDLLNAPGLPVEATESTVKSLELSDDSIDPTSISKPGWPLVPWLVREELTADTAHAFIAIADAQWEVKEELIGVSAKFPSYFPTLSLTADDLRDIASKRTPDSAKQVMLDHLDSIQDQLPGAGAAALATWAGERGLKLSGEALCALASKAGHADPKALIRLLGLAATTLDLDSMTTVLNSLGQPYGLLTSPGWKRPKIPISDGIVAVLARLEQEQIVSSYLEDKKNRVLVVSKKHR